MARCLPVWNRRESNRGKSAAGLTAPDPRAPACPRGRRTVDGQWADMPHQAPALGCVVKQLTGPAKQSTADRSNANVFI